MTNAPEYLPTPALRPFIKRFVVVEFPTHTRDAHLPHTSSVAAFTFRGQCRIDDKFVAPPAAFTGLYDRIRKHEHRDAHGVVLTMFTSTGAAAFAQAPLGEFGDGTTGFAELVGATREVDALCDILTLADNHHERIAHIEAFLLTRLRITKSDPMVAAAVNWLKHHAGAPRIAELTNYIGLSQSALERRFNKVVGISPKKFASLVRLKRVMQLRKSVTDLSTLAQSAGYFDQSHFTNDFQRMTGASPSTYFESASVR